MQKVKPPEIIKDAQPPRIIEGGPEEMQDLFGFPLPALPEGPGPTGDQQVFLVQLHPRLQQAFLTFLDGTARSLTEGVGERREFKEAEWSYFQLLLKINTNIIENERRSGLLNLFWLAHSKEIAATIEEYFGREGIPANVKYKMHPLVRGFYRLLQRLTWAHFAKTAPQTLEYNLGIPFNMRLIDCLFEDQLPLTEVDFVPARLEHVLVPENRRFRINREEYKELRAVLRDRIRQGVARQERTLTDLIKTHFPRLDASAYDQEPALLKMVFHPAIVTYLFTDHDETLKRLAACPALKAGRNRRDGWHNFLHDYVDFIDAVRRCEAIDQLRRGIALIPPGLDEIQLKQYFAEGRLFRFLESTEVLNTARKVTILFADLRGFTAASEGGISEMELTRSLYTVFDPVVGIVKQFKGQIDKFTGDGVMITFGTTQVTPEDEMNALRTAVAILAMVSDLPKERGMSYRMGISLHTGRAQIGRFFPDEKSAHLTVIGRHVNIGSRVTGSGGRASEADDAKTAHSGQPNQDVWIDQYGVLYNWGIAATQEHVEILRRGGGWEIEEGESGIRYTRFDGELQKKILIEYVGDAKLKGVERAQPIYRVVALDDPAKPG